jgi:hypothetical protein
MSRIEHLDTFWMYYLSEHAEPTTRALHFVGTTGFLAALLASLWLAPLMTGAALIASGFILIVASRLIEPRRTTFLPGAMVVALFVAAMPTIMPFGIVFGYLCAWVGHFNFEGNRPATFRYPVWSLICDFRMYRRMCMGQLWTGDLSQAVLESA